MSEYFILKEIDVVIDGDAGKPKDDWLVDSGAELLISEISDFSSWNYASYVIRLGHMYFRYSIDVSYEWVDGEKVWSNKYKESEGGSVVAHRVKRVDKVVVHTTFENWRADLEGDQEVSCGVI